MEDFSVGRAHHIQGNDKERQIWLWHQRLGHPSFGYMKHLFHALFSHVVTSDFQCNTCVLAKSYRASYPLNMNKSNILFALVNSALWGGPSPVFTSSGVHWFVIFIDDCSRMTWLYHLKNKERVF